MRRVGDAEIADYSRSWMMNAKSAAVTHSGGSNLIQIEIRDKGQGMAEDLVKQVMSRPFVTRKQNGTGLGLWTAKKIIENHGGTLELVSRPQIGTTVVVQLPTDCNSEQSTTDH